MSNATQDGQRGTKNNGVSDTEFGKSVESQAQIADAATLASGTANGEMLNVALSDTAVLLLVAPVAAMACSRENLKPLHWHASTDVMRKSCNRHMSFGNNVNNHTLIRGGGKPPLTSKLFVFEFHEPIGIWNFSI